MNDALVLLVFASDKFFGSTELILPKLQFRIVLLIKALTDFFDLFVTGLFHSGEEPYPFIFEASF